MADCDCRGHPEGDPVRHNGECLVLREARMAHSEEGRAQLRAEYHAKLRAEVLRRAQHGEAVDLPSRLQQLGVPALALIALRKGATATEAVKAAKVFAEDKSGLMHTLLLLGPTGVGKTVAAAHVATEVARRFPWNSLPTGSAEHPLMFLSARELTGLSAWNPEHARWLDAMTSARLLVLDDAGDEGTRFGCDAVANLVIARHDKRRRTVVTSNLRPDAFEARYGKALVERIRTGGLAPNLFGQASMRQMRAPF